MNRIKRLLVVGLALAGLAFVGIGCDGNGDNGVNKGNGGGLNKIYAEHTAPASKLFEGTWKLAGVVDDKTGSLQELEPKDCEECYTMTFDTETTFSSFSTSNHGTGTYNYGTHNFRITRHGGTEIGERGDGNLWVSTLWAVESFSLLENELRLYYDGGKKYLLFNPNL